MEQIIPNANITVVVQGPVQSLSDRAQEKGDTQHCLNSIRKYLPSAHIILSTWHNQNLTGLDFDELVLCSDPGSNVRGYNVNGKVMRHNNNRQIVSTTTGLKSVKTKYAVKLRSDNYLISNKFVAMQTSFPKRGQYYRFLKERVVVCNLFSRQYTKGQRVAFHLSDFFYFGLTEDLLTLWDLELLPDFEPSEASKFTPSFPKFLIDCTQTFWLKALQKFEPSISLNDLLDNTSEKLRQSDQCYANNLVIASNTEIGLGICNKFKGAARASRIRGQCSFIQFKEWQQWYKLYCDPEFNLDFPLSERIKLQFLRTLYVYPVALETAVRLFRRRQQ
jgi:hypothetical protein